MKKKGKTVRHSLGLLTCFLLVACNDVERNVFSGPVAGLEYRNQNTAPWPWVSVVPSERALALKDVEFEVISQQLHFDMAFEYRKNAFKDVRIVLLDYTILPEEILKDNKVRPQRYFMVASFYKIGKSPPSPPDFEVTTSLRIDKAGPQEAMRHMARDIIDEIQALNEDCLLTPGRKIMINLD